MQKLKAISQFISKEKFFLLLAIGSYFLFFARLWQPQNFFWGSDAEIFHYPARHYLHEITTQEGRYPFWTERILLGYPLYADTENAYLNIVNVLSIILFGPILSFKIVHFLHYLIGSFAIKKILEKHNIGILGWLFANTAFYFSFFFLNHGIHIDIVMVAFMLPLGIYLLELFFLKPSFKYLILQALLVAYTIYWGHPQMVIPVVAGIFLYYVTVIATKTNFKKGLIYFLLFLTIGVSLALPQLYPSYKMYTQSAREEDPIDPKQGSLPPRLNIVTIFPFIYGRWHYYHGNVITTKYTYTETYIYIGLTTFLVFLIGLLFLKKRHKFMTFAYTSMWVFLILASIRFLPGIEFVPPISMFRYWNRFIFLTSFAIGLAGAYIISNLNQLNLKPLKDFKWITLSILPFVYLYLIDKIYAQDILLEKTNRSLNNLQTQFFTTKDIVLWFAILIAVPLLFLLKRYLGNKITALILVLVLFVDLRFYGQDVLNVRIDKATLPEIQKIEKFEKQRVLFETVTTGNDDVEGNSSLLFKSWTPYGYSQFTPNDYNNYYINSKIGTRTKSSYAKIITDADHKNLRQSGFTTIFTEAGPKELNAKSLKLDLIRTTENIIDAKYIKKEEGAVVFEIETNSALTLETNIKYSPNWTVKVNGNKVELSKDREIFSNIQVPKGKSIVEFTYLPKDILVGLGFGLVGALFFGTIGYKSKFWI